MDWLYVFSAVCWAVSAWLWRGHRPWLSGSCAALSALNVLFAAYPEARAYGDFLLAGSIAVMLWILAVAQADHTRNAVETERRRVSSYLRRQSKIAEVVSTCRYLGAKGQDQEAYAAAVLEETAWEIDGLEHHAQVVK